jgi:hypothetical protein
MLAVVLLMAAGAGSAAAEAETPRALVERAVAVAGGDLWLDPQTLVLEGSADFYSPNAAGPVRHVDDYRMWRAMDTGRTAAHAADGKVRITAKMQGKLLFEVGYDGATTWNDKGIVPKAEADRYWAENFGFGIIRQALKQGFTLERAPDRDVGGHALKMVRVIDAAGVATLFGIDAKRHFIRYMGFATPRGWHERVYDDFVIGRSPRWLQAREVTLFYNGVRQNTVHWKRFTVGRPIPDSQFSPPRELANIAGAAK